MSKDEEVSELVLVTRADLPSLFVAANRGDEKAAHVVLALADAVAACTQTRRPERKTLGPHKCMLCDKLIIREKPDIFWAMVFQLTNWAIAFGLHRACTKGRPLQEIGMAVFAGVNRETVAEGFPELQPLNIANVHNTGGSA
jgi:hypothetical protein